MLTPLSPLVVALYALQLWLIWGAPKHRSLPWLAGSALFFHALLASEALFANDALHFDLVTSASAVMVLILGGQRLLLTPMPRPVATVMLAAAAACAALQGLIPPAIDNPVMEDWLFRAHVIVAVSAYVLLALAAIMALTVRLADHRLHKRPGSRVAHALPPLLVLEQRLFRLVLGGFVLLTVTLLTGIFFLKHMMPPPKVFTHKTIFSLLAWLMFAGLLLGRHRYGWRGRIAINGTLGGFLLLLLAYFGTKFVLAVILHRAPV